MARIAGYPPEAFEALGTIREATLRAFTSLFTPTQTIWTRANVDRFHTLFVENFDEGEGDFLEKFEKQLAGAGDDVIQLAAELLYIQQFFTSQAKAEKKIANVAQVLEWGKRSVAIPDWAGAAIAKGFASDMSFNQSRAFHMAWLSDFYRAWHRTAENQDALLSDPWAFREFTHSVVATNKAYQPMREAWLFMIFPDTFENISSRNDKKRIREAFCAKLGIPSTLNIDKDLLAIRERLKSTEGPGFAFYKSPLKEVWSEKKPADQQVTREAILEAMDSFDDEERDNSEWLGWEANGNYKFAIESDGALYPPKHILSLATGKDTSSFSGGEATNKVFTAHGFVIRELRTGGPLVGLSAAFAGILSNYADARETGTFGKDHPVFAHFRAAQAALRSSTPVLTRPHIKVEFSAGRGNWSDVPWIALLDDRETRTTQNGRYVVFLFREDCTGVYITLNQGVTEPKREMGRAAGIQFVRERAQSMRSQIQDLDLSGFELTDNIVLHEEGLGKDYEASTVAHRLYSAGAVPADAELERDLERVLAAYDAVLAPATPAAAWIFQGNPEMYDVSGSVRALKELLWTVKQHAGTMRIGERVYVWESGPNAGIVATATIVGDVREQADDAASAEFWRKGAPDGVEPRVRIRIDRVLDSRLTRKSLQDDPRLADLAFLKAPMGTNFLISDVHRKVLEEHLAPKDVTPNQLVDGFAQALRAAGLTFGAEHDMVVQAFVASVLTKPFIILTGLSGSGKTQLAIQFAEWIAPKRNKVIAVRPDWTGPEALLGYEDALLPATSSGQRAWHVPKALELMLDAARDPQRPYVLVLDEMNLAHVERYFADVLSGVESRKEVLPNLVRGADKLWRLPPTPPVEIVMPRNLIIIGTVNVDETTYMFSPKVLDRANTIEFRVSTDALPIDLRALVKPGICKPASNVEVASFLRIVTDDSWHTKTHADTLESFAGHVRNVHDALSSHGLEFGHRTYYESLRLATVLRATGMNSTDAAVDTFLLQKILPRLHGSRRKLEPILRMLGAFAFNKKFPTKVGDFDLLAAREEPAALPRSYAKLLKMMRALQANQFASFSD